MYIVGFNGPPESGKDSLAEGLSAVIDSEHNIPWKFESLSMPLREIAYAMVGWKIQSLDGPAYEEFKRTVFEQFGVTGRQLMIDVSEKFLKTTYGIDVMARLFIERNKDFHGIILLRDSGFQIEVDPIIEAVGPGNFYIARCHRPGKDFSNDSREYISHPYVNQPLPGGYSFALDSDLYNMGDEWDWRSTEARRLYGRLLNQAGWQL